MEGNIKHKSHKDLTRRFGAAQRLQKHKFKNLFSQNTNEFCKNTTLHGLRYIVDTEIHPMDRIFFAISFVLVVMAAAFFILSVYTKWRTTPVIFGINPEPILITSEPFPAVTICNLNQALKSKADNYSVDSVEYAMLQLLCRRKVNVSVVNSITDWNNLEGFITKISQPCEEMLLLCRYGGITFNCTDFFQPIITDEGFCCVFNMVHPQFLYYTQTSNPSYAYANDYEAVKWNPEYGYANDLPKKFIPQRTAGTGEFFGLSVTLDVDVDNYYCSSSNSIGFKIAFYNPTEIPNMQESGLLLAAGKETKVRIRAEKVESESQLRWMSKYSRKCLFQDEIRLKYFQHYSQRNCEIECTAALMRKHCGCISHHLPKIDDAIDTCSIYDLSCLERVRKSFIANDACRECLSGCFDLMFNPDFFSTPLSHVGFSVTNPIVRNLSSDYVKNNIAIVNLYFKEDSYRSNKRAEYIGFTDFLSSVGGLMGLFLGFSFISVAELFYYAIVRPYRIVHRKKKEATPKLSGQHPASFRKGHAIQRDVKTTRLIDQNLLHSISGKIVTKEQHLCPEKLYAKDGMGSETPIYRVKSRFGLRNENSSYGKTLLVKQNVDITKEDQFNDNENICSQAGVQKSIKYYLRNTTLHGLKYIAEDSITITERAFFGLAFVLVIILSAFFISNIYTKWSASPIIISTSAKQTLTTDLPFPAITICNLNQALKGKVSKIPRPSANFTLLMSLCDQGGDIAIQYIGTWKFFKALLIEVAQPCKEMLLYCSFGSKPENCSLIFSSVLTDDGLCCTFNALDPMFLFRNYTEESRLSHSYENQYNPIDWTPETGYPKNPPANFVPRTSGGTGSRMGLTVILNSSSDQYYCSTSKSVGFKVLVHNPAELPKISNYGFLVTSGREARIPIEPIYQDALPSIRSIRKQVRRCLFSDEGDLVYYRTYSRKNCELECEARILMEKCNCVLYYLPRIDPNSHICGPNDNVCTSEVQAEIESADRNISCDSCWPGCFELSYKATVTATTIVIGAFFSADDFPSYLFDGSTNIDDISILHFYYVSNILRSTTKSEMFGFTEFLSNTGGLLGLFMGFSIFSLIEIVYYVTVRPYCASRVGDKAKPRKEAKLPNVQKRKSYKKELLNSSGWSAFTPNKNAHRKKYKNALHQLMNQKFKTLKDDTQVFPYID